MAARHLSLLTLALTLALALACAVSSCSGAPPRGEAPAPSLASELPLKLTLPKLGGGTLSLEALRGKPVLLSLFTTWCLLCQEEAPRLVRLDERFRGAGLQVVGIALNSEGVRPSSLVALYVEQQGFRFPVAIAAPDDLDLVGALGLTPPERLPRTLLLDGSGRVVLDQVGGTRFQAVENKVLELLGERRPR